MLACVIAPSDYQFNDSHWTATTWDFYKNPTDLSRMICILTRRNAQGDSMYAFPTTTTRALGITASTRLSVVRPPETIDLTPSLTAPVSPLTVYIRAALDSVAEISQALDQARSVSEDPRYAPEARQDASYAVQNLTKLQSHLRTARGAMAQKYENSVEASTLEGSAISIVPWRGLSQASIDRLTDDDVDYVRAMMHLESAKNWDNKVLLHDIDQHLYRDFITDFESAGNHAIHLMSAARRRAEAQGFTLALTEEQKEETWTDFLTRVGS